MGLTLTASNLLAEIDHVAPFALAESWDNVGLMVGDPRQPVTGILVGLDPTEALLDEAMAAGANTIVTHHPLLFKPPKSIRTDQPLGRTIAKALANNLTLIACHTNLDVVGRGVSAILAEKLGLTDCQPLDGADTIGFGRIGTLAPPLPGDRFLQKASAAMQCQSLLVAGTVPSSVSRVAVCGGSGSELAEKALELGAEIYVTAEIKHSTARWAEMAGICLIDAGHFATENIVTHEFAFRINEALATAGHTIPVHVSNRQQPPFAVYCATGGTMTPETL